MSLRNSFDQSAPAEQPVVLPVQDQWANTMNFYHTSTDEVRQGMLSILTEQAKHALYQHYLDDLDADVRQMEAAQHPASAFARAMHAELEAARNDSRSRVPDVLLFDALHKTNRLVKTPVLAQDNTINPEFTRCAAEYTTSMDQVRKAGRQNFAMGLCHALCGALLLAGVALMFVLTFGHVLPNPDVTLNVVLAGSQTMMAGIIAAPAIRFFSTYRNEKALADTMQPLVPALRNENNRPGL